MGKEDNVWFTTIPFKPLTDHRGPEIFGMFCMVSEDTFNFPKWKTALNQTPVINKEMTTSIFSQRILLWIEDGRSIEITLTVPLNFLSSQSRFWAKKSYLNVTFLILTIGVSCIYIYILYILGYPVYIYILYIYIGVSCIYIFQTISILNLNI